MLEKQEVKFFNMKQINSTCMECGESITNPICPECIVEQAIACLADKQISGKLAEKELWKINKKLAAILKANYTEVGVDCISCKSTFAVCPHCTARYLKDILSRYHFSYLFSFLNY